MGAVSRWLGATALLVPVLVSCAIDEGQRVRSRQGAAYPGADGDADSDGDGDADGDIDVVGGGDEDLLACKDAADCVLAVQVDQCCACPSAVTVGFEAAGSCLVPWPAVDDPPAECVRQCGACDECTAPEGAVCADGRCRLKYAGDCVTREDCAAGEICLVSHGQSSCALDPTLCEGPDDCDGYSWCAEGADGLARCRELEPGACGSDLNCDEDDRCEGASGSQTGLCVPAEEGE